MSTKPKKSSDAPRSSVGSDPAADEFDPQKPDLSREWWDLVVRDHGFLRLCWINERRVNDRLIRAGQPWPRQIHAWSRKGIKTLVNLRGTTQKSDWLERDACRKSGMAYERVDKVLSRENPSRETIANLCDLFRRIRYPAVIHCKSGADRAGLASVLFLLTQENALPEDALTHLSLRYGHFRWAKTGVLDYFLESYLAEHRRTGIGFEEWAQTHYDPVAVRSEFHSTWWGRLLGDIILIRE